MKNKLLLFLLLVTIPLNLTAGDGTSAFEFLRTDFSSRSGAMGSSFMGMRGDLNGIFHNPAGLAYTELRQFSFNYMNYLIDISGGQAGYSQRIPEYGQITAAVVYFDYGNFDETDENATETGRTYGANDFAIAVSYSDYLEERFAYGVTLKYIHSKIDFATSSALAMDFGLMYDAPFEDDLFIGLSILNVGTQLSAFVDTRESLPLSVRIGFAKKLAHLPLELNVSFNDLNISEDSILGRLKKFSLGGEFTLSQLLRLRLGYDNDLHQGLDTSAGAGFSGVSFGFGIHYEIYMLDYSFSSLGDLGNAHRFGISGSF